MTDPLDAIARLRRFCSRNHDDPDAELVACGLRRCLEGASFNTAFNLTPEYLGAHGPIRQDRLDRRDDILRAAADRHYGDLDVKSSAKAIVAAMKGHPEPELANLISRANKIHPVPTSVRQVERILLGGRT